MRKMKLLLALAITLMLVTACGSTGSTTVGNEGSASQDATEVTETTDDSSADSTGSNGSDATDNSSDAADTNESTDISGADDTEVETPEPETIAFGKKGEIFGLSVNVRKAKIASKFTSGMFEFKANEKGDRLLKVDLTLKNNSGEEVSVFKFVYNPNEDIIAKAIGSDGTEYESLKMIGYSDDLHDKTIEAGKTQKGALIFELPKSAGKKVKKLTLELSAGDEKVDFKLSK